LDDQTRKNPNDETLISRNSRLACDLHAHKLIMHRNLNKNEIDLAASRTLIASFVYLTTRHTWNKATRENGRLLVPETELYELLQHQKRKLVEWCYELKQGELDLVMQATLQVSTSSTGSLRASAEIIDASNRWSRIQGPRSLGRYAVASTRSAKIKEGPTAPGLIKSGEEDEEEEEGVKTSDKDSLAKDTVSSGSGSARLSGSAGFGAEDDDEGDDDGFLEKHKTTTSPTKDAGKPKKKNSLPPRPGMLQRQTSEVALVGTVPDDGKLGVELDLMLAQMTLRSRHLSALEMEIANDPDVRLLFGTSNMQASLLERAEHCDKYRLVGLQHDLSYWKTPHMESPALADEWDRDYDPSELFESESWIPPLFEPIRKQFFAGPMPPEMQFLMPEFALPDDAEVAVLLGLSQTMGGPAKLVYLFRRLKCVHVYQVSRWSFGFDVLIYTYFIYFLSVGVYRSVLDVNFVTVD
jgi:hypothetical protein